MVTIKQLAELCGVSRGTVDRVINGRGNVKPEKEARIRAMMQRLNYQPNPAGKALAARKKTLRVGVLVAYEGVAFFDDVLISMRRMAQKCATYGMETLFHSMHGFDAAEQCREIDALMPEVNALIINPLNHPSVIQKIDACVHAGIFVITVNNDIESSKRHAYVGTDYLNGGRTVGALLRMIHHGPIHAAVLLGSLGMLGHRQRLTGFLDVMNEAADFAFLGVRETGDDEIVSYDAAGALLSECPGLNAFFIASAGAYGAARAVRAAGRKDITLIVFDTIPTTIRMMREGVIQAALYQHPHQQGRRAMQLAFDYLVNGIMPEREKYIMRNEIRIRENMED